MIIKNYIGNVHVFFKQKMTFPKSISILCYYEINTRESQRTSDYKISFFIHVHKTSDIVMHVVSYHRMHGNL